MQYLQTLYAHVEPAIPWITSVSLLMAIISMIAIPFLVIRIPEDYFVAEKKPASHRGPLRWTVWLLRNLLAFVLVLCGVLMLVLPGQGMLTILLGIACSTFPGKYRLERRIVGRPRILRALNWIREKYNKAPLLAPEN
ncbi:MAG: PGPGW domain-containing protein [Alcanivoracaceae bacterium]|nr:PGPGW domain-containing protein [Alcanivoracaceae bacterium]